MRNVWIAWSVLALAGPALRAEDPPKGDKSPKEQFDALVKEFNDDRSKLIPKIGKAKGDDQRKLIDEYQSLGKKYADKVFALAEGDPKSPVAIDAVLWVVQNAAGSDAGKKAVERFRGFLDEMPLKDLTPRLRALRLSDAKLYDAAVARALKDEKDEHAADLLSWVATSAYYMSVGQKAATTLIDKYPDHESVARVVSLLGRGRGADSAATLKSILERSKSDAVKAAAAMALAQSLANRVDQLADKPEEADKIAAEAEKYFTMVIKEFAKSAEAKASAERELNALKTLRIGKEAPEIQADDLDGKAFKLSDYRGKVILLDFWGHW